MKNYTIYQNIGIVNGQFNKVQSHFCIQRVILIIVKPALKLQKPGLQFFAKICGCLEKPEKTCPNSKN